jgi:hypothetical protein
MVVTRSGKGKYDKVPESSNNCRGAFYPPVPPPSPPIPVVSPETLLASQNAIMQKLGEIGECQVGQSCQQPRESSYLNFLATQPPQFAEMTDPLEANH